MKMQWRMLNLNRLFQNKKKKIIEIILLFLKKRLTYMNKKYFYLFYVDKEIRLRENLTRTTKNKSSIVTWTYLKRKWYDEVIFNYINLVKIWEMSRTYKIKFSVKMRILCNSDNRSWIYKKRKRKVVVDD